MMPAHLRKIGVAVLILAVSSCASTREKLPVPEQRSEGYKVSVSSEGHELKDFQQPLVHRLSLSQPQMDQLLGTRDASGYLGVRESKEFDRQGHLIGVRVVEVKQLGRLTTFGLKHNDIITAFGRSQPKGVGDLQNMVRELREKGTASMTIVREGRPHKVLFSISS